MPTSSPRGRRSRARSSGNASSSGDEERDDDARLRGRGRAQARCLADQLWLPFYLIVRSPKTTAYTFGVAYSLVVLVCFTIQGLANLLTPPGLVLLGVYAVYAAIFGLSRCLSYPASVSVVLRDVELECAQRMRHMLQGACARCEECVQLLGRAGASPGQVWEITRAYGDLKRARQSTLRKYGELPPATDARASKCPTAQCSISS